MNNMYFNAFLFAKRDAELFVTLRLLASQMEVAVYSINVES